MTSTTSALPGASDSAIDEILALFESRRAMAYLGEEVTTVQHQLQAGHAALAAGVPDSTVVAALLHDVGHMIVRDAGEAFDAGTDDHHDDIGSRWLAQWFGPAVTEPVRLHVAAKRFLVATEPDYVEQLSAASVYTLSLQGGPMSAAEVVDFVANPAHSVAVAVRRFDEAAKDASFEAPKLQTFVPLLRAALAGTTTSRT